MLMQFSLPLQRRRCLSLMIFLAAASSAAIVPLHAQSSAERDRQRAEEKAERDRQARERAVERARERSDRDKERERASSLDTVVTFDARGTVNVDCSNGAIVVTVGDRNEIRVRARTGGGAIRFSSNGSRASLEPSSGRGCSEGRFEVTVPAGTHLVANTWSGSLSVRGVQGDVELHSQSGDVDSRDTGGRLDIESLSGDVTITNTRGETSVHTISGDLQLHTARGTLTLETVSGDLDLSDVVTKQVRTHTTNGDVSFQGAIMDQGRYEFTTHSGEIGLQVSPDIGAELSFSTFNGSIDSDFPITLKAGEHGIGSAQAKHLNFTVGRGTARIVAETFSGDITLRRHR